MGQLVLTKNQKKIIEIVSKEENLKDFYLSGGTALAAYYLEHRFSDDLDFFTENNIDAYFLDGLMARIKKNMKAGDLRYERLYDRHQYFLKFDNDLLKIEFTKYPFTQLSKPGFLDGIKIDSLRDLAANKLVAMLDRFDPKDFVDLYFLFQKFDLEKVQRDVKLKFNISINSIFLGGELAKARRIAALPRMITPLEIDELKSFFENLSLKLKPQIF